MRRQDLHELGDKEDEDEVVPLPRRGSLAGGEIDEALVENRTDVHDAETHDCEDRREEDLFPETSEYGRTDRMAPRVVGRFRPV